jgi:SAM-dependent methyltransferase
MRLLILLLLVLVGGTTVDAQATWRGRNYSGPLCTSRNCSMCASIRSQLYQPVTQVVSAPVQVASSQQYTTETRYRTETYQQKHCQGRQCWYTTESRQVPYPVRVPIQAVASVEHVFIPTPEAVVESMLGIVHPNPGDRVYDLGCGDGRIIEKAITQYAAVGVGVEINPDTFNLACERLSPIPAEKWKLYRGDATEHSLEDADVVALYMFPAVIDKLRLDTLKPGAKVISYQHDIPGYDTEKRLCSIDGEDHEFYVYEEPYPFAAIEYPLDELVSNTPPPPLVW